MRIFWPYCNNGFDAALQYGVLPLAWWTRLFFLLSPVADQVSRLYPFHCLLFKVVWGVLTCVSGNAFY